MGTKTSSRHASDSQQPSTRSLVWTVRSRQSTVRIRKPGLFATMSHRTKPTKRPLGLEEVRFCQPSSFGTGGIQGPSRRSRQSRNGEPMRISAQSSKYARNIAELAARYGIFERRRPIALHVSIMDSGFHSSSRIWSPAEVRMKNSPSRRVELALRAGSRRVPSMHPQDFSPTPVLEHSGSSRAH